jgi:hypothetical protein
VNVIEKAKPLRLIRDLNVALPEQKIAMDEIQRLFCKGGRDERSKVGGSVFPDSANNVGARKILLNRQLYVGMRFVIAKQDVVARLIFFDEVVFEQESFEGRICDDEVDLRGFGKHPVGKWAAWSIMEVRAHALAKGIGFSDIDRASLLILEYVDTGLLG